MLSSCYRLQNTSGGGQVDRDIDTRRLDTADIAVPDGYEIEVIAAGLNFPTSITFDDEGRAYVTESGYSYGEKWALPRLLRLNENGQTEVVAAGGINGPWTGSDYSDGYFYIAEGGHLAGGRILRIDQDGEREVLADSLPGFGDHHTNSPLINDGYVYFGQGTATNSGIVGIDSAEFGWLKRNPDFHDIPCEDISLTGQNFETVDVLNEESDENVFTGAYSPFGESTEEGQVIEGRLPCNGAVMRIPVEGGPVELVAWGLRNPFGLAYSPDGRLFATDNGYDDRGSRPVWGTGDLLWEIETGTWYGWPDFSGHHSLTDNDEYKAPGEAAIEPLLAQHPNEPPEPTAIFGVHSSANGIDFSANAEFGYEGEAFIAQFGDMAPGVGKVLSPVGFKVVKADVSTGVIEDFAVNKGSRNGPATWLDSGGLERPVDVKFDPSGETLYIVDFGIMRMSEEGPEPVKETGVVFKITRTEE
ncbi:MAG: hypothetical protein WD028_08150 [Balneolaceae bacterium]